MSWEMAAMAYFSSRSSRIVSMRSCRPASSRALIARHSRRGTAPDILTVRRRLLAAGVSSRIRAISSI